MEDYHDLTASDLRRERLNWQDGTDKVLGCIRSKLGQNPRAAWSNTNLSTEGTVTALSTQLRQIQTDFGKLDKTCVINEPHLIHKFLFSLGPDYNTFLSSFSQHHSIIPERGPDDQITKNAVTFDEAIRAAQHEEQQLEHQKSQDNTKALAAFRNNKRKDPPVCTHCSKAGRRMTRHESDKCFYEHPELVPAHWNFGKQKQQKTEHGKPITAGLSHTQHSDDEPREHVTTLMAFRDTSADEPCTPTKPSILSRIFRGRLPGDESPRMNEPEPTSQGISVS
ncbi:hypothetical protein F4804DRAFT_352342, partial [Jackrogersella minutella]